MNVTVSGVEATLREVLKTADGDTAPVVTVPSVPSLSSVVGVINTHPCRLVVDEGVLDSSNWPTLGRLSDVVEEIELRTSSIDQTAVVTQRAVGTICTDTRPPTGVVAEPSDGVIQQFESIWRQASPREVSCPTYEAVINAVATVGDDSAVDDVRNLCQAVRGGESADAPVGVAVWAAARSEPEVTTLREEIPPRLGCGERTVSRRVRQLADVGLVRSLRVPDGSPGRPSQTVTREQNPPLTSVGRRQLLSVSG